MAPTVDETLDISALETWLWDAACKIRGATDAPKFKDFILPLVFYKRLSDVFDDEFARKVEEFGGEELAWELVKLDHEDALKSGRPPVIRFYIPREYRWDKLRHHPADGDLGQFVTTAMREVARLNPELQGVLDVKDFNERQSGQRTLGDEHLTALIEVLSRHRLGLNNTQPDILGRAYEYLLRKFAEGQGQSAGEFYTPLEVGWLMAQLINPTPHSRIYDPTCGSAGLLIKARLLFEEQRPEQKSKAPKLYGQERNAITFAMAKMNMFLHGYTDAFFAIGDTFLHPGFATSKAGLERFDYVVANPMWNQKNYTKSFYENDKWGRFTFGIPPNNNADWGWLQHMLASLNDNGRAAIVIGTNAVSRGSGGKSTSKEKEIRKAFVEHDFIEGVILLPENLFYNTTAPGIILLLNCNKALERRGQILLVNASKYFVKKQPKNELTMEGIELVTGAYRRWATQEKLSRVITLEEARGADYNLSPSQFVEIDDQVEHRLLPEILTELTAARAERKHADEILFEILEKLLSNNKPKNFEKTEIDEPPQNWQFSDLGKKAKEFISGGTPSTKEGKFWDGDIPWTTSAPISETDIFLECGQRFITNRGLKNSASHLVPKGNLLVGTRVGVGKAVVNLIDVAISQDLTGIILDKFSTNPTFIAYQFKTHRIASFLKGRKRGTTIKGIARLDLHALPLLIPPLKEQQAIASALRAVQEARVARQREAAVLEELFGAMLEELMNGRRSALPLVEPEGTA